MCGNSISHAAVVADTTSGTKIFSRNEMVRIMALELAAGMMAGADTMGKAVIDRARVFEDYINGK